MMLVGDRHTIVVFTVCNASLVPRSASVATERQMSRRGKCAKPRQQHHTGDASINPRNSVKKSMTVIVSYLGDVSVVILIRTDTTLDHSQKAEKVYLNIPPRN
jgi:hypothetical protein